jgi:hypothetical protein
MRRALNLPLASLAVLAGLLLCGSAAPAPAWANQPSEAASRPGLGRPRQPGPRDPLVPILRRMDRYLQRNETHGVDLDYRYDLAPTEIARLTATCQLLGYAELYRVMPRRRFRQDVAQRADFLLDRFESVRSGTVFDGMLGYAMVKAYETTHDLRYLDHATTIVNELEAIPRTEYILNGGLMAAMAFASYSRVTGDTTARDLARLVLDGLPPFQHTDGSFPHWCVCSRDVHYTDWMSMELILIQRDLDHPVIAPTLAGILSFIEQRVNSQGRTEYEASCPNTPNCTIYYYSIATGCGIDYDTRAFTNELGYTALLFDHFHSPSYAEVMAFTDSLEHGGTFADKWDFWPPPEDDYYVWTVADTSVINMSINLWSFAATLSGRRDRAAEERAWIEDEIEDPEPVTRTVESIEPITVAHASRTAESDTPNQTSALDPPHRTSVLDPLRARGASGIAYCDWIVGPAPVAPALSAAIEHRPANATLPRLTLATFGAPREAGVSLRLKLEEPGAVTIDVMDAAGRRVHSEALGTLAAGTHALRWNGQDDGGRACPSGLYFVRARAGHDVARVRVPLVR